MSLIDAWKPFNAVASQGYSYPAVMEKILNAFTHNLGIFKTQNLSETDKQFATLKKFTCEQFYDIDAWQNLQSDMNANFSKQLAYLTEQISGLIPGLNFKKHDQSAVGGEPVECDYACIPLKKKRGRPKAKRAFQAKAAAHRATRGGARRGAGRPKSK